MKTGELVKGNRGQKFSGWDVEVRRTNLRAESKAIESERNLKLMPSGEARRNAKEPRFFLTRLMNRLAKLRQFVSARIRSGQRFEGVNRSKKNTPIAKESWEADKEAELGGIREFLSVEKGRTIRDQCSFKSF